VGFHSVSETCKLGGGGSDLESDSVCGIVCKDGEGLQTVFEVVGVRWVRVCEEIEGVTSKFLVCSKVQDGASSSIGPVTYTARSETAFEKPSFWDAWRWGRHCIVPAPSFFEPDWRSGKAVTARNSRADGQLMGLWLVVKLERPGR